MSDQIKAPSSNISEELLDQEITLAFVQLAYSCRFNNLEKLEQAVQYRFPDVPLERIKSVSFKKSPSE